MYVCMFVCPPTKCSTNHSIRKVNKSFENVPKFIYLGTTLTNQNVMLEEIKNALISGNACCCSFQCILSSCLLSEMWRLKYF